MGATPFLKRRVVVNITPRSPLVSDCLAQASRAFHRAVLRAQQGRRVVPASGGVLRMCCEAPTEGGDRGFASAGSAESERRRTEWGK